MKAKTIILIVLIASIVILSGCTQQPPAPAAKCGNNVVEAGEQCDGTAGNCTEGKVCLQNCTCGIPQPPALPE